MACARQRAEWYRAAVMTAYLLQPNAKEQVKPLSLIPPAYRPRIERPKVNDERQKEITRRVLDGLERRTKRK